MMEISRTLAKMMHKLNISEKAATGIMNMLKTEEQQLEMKEYLEDNKDIITDHQAIQHLAKIIYKDKN